MKIDYRFSVSNFALAVIFLLSALLFFAPSALAKGNFSKIVISGGHLTSDIEVTDPALLGFFSLSDFPNARVNEPLNVSQVYVISRGGEENHAFKAWDRLLYYPNSNGPGGYIYYEGLLNGWSEYDGKWYIASTEGDAALRRLLGISPYHWPLYPSKNRCYPL